MDSLVPALSIIALAITGVVLFQRLGLGAILGYLVAGIAAGPFVLGLYDNPVSLLHAAEIGVVLLLFVIGLELEPDKLWRMKRMILSLGGGQLMLTALVLAVALYGLLAPAGQAVFVILALALALSSTAFAMQLLEERSITQSREGRKAFAILLMQDLAVIPVLLIVQGYAGKSPEHSVPWWCGLLAVAGVLVLGRYVVNPLLRLVSRYGSKEVMSALALLIVLGTAVGMESAGLSMGLGAFTAGILLANSSFRHQLETDIEPFKGLLLGLFFVAIGMTLDLSLLWQQPLLLIAAALALMLIKTLVITLLMRLTGSTMGASIRMAVMLAQGGEFAFVVMSQSLNLGILPDTLAAQVTLVVGLSMAFTSPLLNLVEWLLKRLPARPEPEYDERAEEEAPRVIIAGFGRFGQIAGRLLAANHIRFTALDKNAAHIEFVRRFGNKVFFGDAARLDLLQAAGIDHAEVCLIAIDDEAATEQIIEVLQTHYPKIHIIARVRNRFSYLNFYDNSGLEMIRELFGSSLEAAERIMLKIGFSDTEAKRKITLFRQHDEAMMKEMAKHGDDVDKIIATGVRSRKELEALFERDKQGL
ncbi:potassium transporter [Idiomarina tyrosinivorans]|uniref:Potassium transporter n=1 Tax=Idiomarina tyrosinivorans TaxID=1445662 RepID=A0A432ZQ56_9GAMM|nr:potassium transporter [Idiomarina tyrosinivorans]